MNASLANIYSSLGRNEDARSLAEHAVASATSLYGARAARTLAAEVTLCAVMAQLGRGKEVVARIDQLLPVTAELAMAEPTLRRDSLLAAVSVYNDARLSDKAELSLAQYQQLLEKAGALSAWDAAEIDGYRADIAAVRGNIETELALLKKHEAVYLNPPPQKTKIGLTFLGQMISAQLALNNVDGLEARAVALIKRWDSLAGPNNRNSLAILDEIGFYQTRFGTPTAANRAYQDRVNRLSSSPNNDYAVEYAKLDLLEVDTLFALAPDAALRQRLAELVALTELPGASVGNTARRLFRFRWRLLYVAAAFGDVATMERLYAAAAEFIRTEGITAGNDYLSLQSSRNGLLLAKGEFEAAAPDLYAAFKARTMQRGAYAYFAYATRTAVALALAGPAHEAHAKDALLAAQQARPSTVNEQHRAVLALHYAEALVTSKDGNSAMAVAAREKLARALGRTSAQDLPPQLFGLLFY